MISKEILCVKLCVDVNVRKNSHVCHPSIPNSNFHQRLSKYKIDAIKKSCNRLSCDNFFRQKRKKKPRPIDKPNIKIYFFAEGQNGLLIYTLPSKNAISKSHVFKRLEENYGRFCFAFVQ